MRLALFVFLLLFGAFSSSADHGQTIDHRDGFDSFWGARVTAHSTLLSGVNAGDLFGEQKTTTSNNGEAGHVLFHDDWAFIANPPVDYIEFSTTARLALTGFRLVAQRDGDNPLRALGQFVFQVDPEEDNTYVTIATIPANYGPGGIMDVTHAFPRLEARKFRIEITRGPLASHGARLIELDAITEFTMDVPEISWVRPEGGQELANPNEVILVVDASDRDGIESVDFFAGDTWIGRSEDGSTFTWKQIPAGNVVLKARAVDRLGWVTESAGRVIEVTRTPFRLTSISRGPALLQWESGSPDSILVLQRKTRAEDPWVDWVNLYSTRHNHQGFLALPSEGFSWVRAELVALTPDGAGFNQWVNHYSELTTVAGMGGVTQDVNQWLPSFEGKPASQVLLSRPHITLGDAHGNLYIADKSAHAIRKVNPAGIMTTVMGINVPENGSDEPAPAATIALNEPNGLWVRPDGGFYVLDLGNAKVRKVTAAGISTTLFRSPGLSRGRGLWVNAEETLAYVSSGTTLKRWTASGGLTDFATGFADLGNVVVDEEGNIWLTDREAHRVYRLKPDGSDRKVVAGNGSTTGGGDGLHATDTGLNQVRGIWLVPSGGFLLATDAGSQVWFVDPQGIIHLVLNGNANHVHAGDNAYFYSPNEARVSKVRAITMDPFGNLLITESDKGYVRRISFERKK